MIPFHSLQQAMIACQTKHNENTLIASVPSIRRKKFIEIYCLAHKINNYVETQHNARFTNLLFYVFGIVICAAIMMASILQSDQLLQLEVIISSGLITLLVYRVVKICTTPTLSTKDMSVIADYIAKLEGATKYYSYTRHDIELVLQQKGFIGINTHEARAFLQILLNKKSSAS